MNKWSVLRGVFIVAVLGSVLYFYETNKCAGGDVISAYYIENYYMDTSARNAVSAIYLNYRVFDSIFETLMLLVSSAAVIHFSKRSRNE